MVNDKKTIRTVIPDLCLLQIVSPFLSIFLSSRLFLFLIQLRLGPTLKQIYKLTLSCYLQVPILQHVYYSILRQQSLVNPSCECQLWRISILIFFSNRKSPPNVVTFEVSSEMTRIDVKNYLTQVQLFTNIHTP